MSAHPCGCDPEANWVSENCKGPEGCLSFRRSVWPTNEKLAQPEGYKQEITRPTNPKAASAEQPAPRVQPGGCIQDLVIADIEARKALGLERYGTLLQANNGRDALVDAYQEALDLVQYLRQVIEERELSRQ